MCKLHENNKLIIMFCIILEASYPILIVKKLLTLGFTRVSIIKAHYYVIILEKNKFSNKL